MNNRMEMMQVPVCLEMGEAFFFVDAQWEVGLSDDMTDEE